MTAYNMESKLFDIEHQDGESETAELKKVRFEDPGGARVPAFISMAAMLIHLGFDHHGVAF